MKQLYFFVLLSYVSFSCTVENLTSSLDESLYFVAETHPTNNHDFHIIEVFEDSPGCYGRLYRQMQNSGGCFRYKGYEVHLVERSRELFSVSQMIRSVTAQIRVTYQCEIDDDDPE